MNWILVGGKGSVAFFFFFFRRVAAEGIIWNSPASSAGKHGILFRSRFSDQRSSSCLLCKLNYVIRYSKIIGWFERGSIYTCWDKKWTDEEKERTIVKIDKIGYRRLRFTIRATRMWVEFSSSRRKKRRNVRCNRNLFFVSITISITIVF